VVRPLEGVEDPREHLSKLIERHVHMLLTRPREVTIILHERTALTGVYREKIQQRKKPCIDYVRKLLTELQKRGDARKDVDVTAGPIGLEKGLRRQQRPQQVQP